jgi:phage terminase large subunit-like protein
LTPDPWQADAIDLLLACRADGKWACYEYGEIVARQNGKGSILEIRVLAGFLLLGEQLIMWSAHEYKTSMEAFRRMRTLIKRLGRQVNPNNENLWDVDGVPVKIVNTNGEEGFERADTEARIKFVARSKGSGRGFSGDLVIIDESFAYTMEQQDALMPAMAARPNAQIIYTSSPPLSGASGEVMFALKKRADAGGDDSLGWRDWGVAGDLDHLDDIDLDDRDLWAASNPALGMRLTEETILRERRSMGDAGFARERLCIWPQVARGNQVIDPAVWARLADEASQRTGSLALGVDLSPLRDYAAVCVYGHRADGLGHAQLADYRPGTKWLVPRLVELRNALGPIAISMGRGTFAFLETDLDKAGFKRPDDEDNPEPGDLAVTGAIEMAAATGQILEAVREENFRYIPARHLDSAVAGAKTRATGDTIAWTPKGAEVDTSPLVAMSVARWAFEMRSHLLEEASYDLLKSVF